MSDPRPFNEFREEGLLWLVNRVVFHPRGHALAFHYDDHNDVVGWSLLGDGTEPWSMGDPPPEAIAAGALTEDELFARVAVVLGPARNEPEPTCICPRFSDTGGYRIADLTCPVHGPDGTDPGDGMWDTAEQEPKP